MESGDCCWLIKGNGDDGTTSKPCQAHSERGGEATLEPFLQFVFAIHGSRQQSRLALGIALPCHCPAMLPRCSGHAESISLNRILTYLFWSEPRYKYVCGFSSHTVNCIVNGCFAKPIWRVNRVLVPGDRTCRSGVS